MKRPCVLKKWRNYSLAQYTSSVSAPQCVITTSDRVSRWVVRSPQEITVGLPKFIGYRLDGVPLYQGSKQLILKWDILSLGDLQTILDAYFTGERTSLYSPSDRVAVPAKRRRLYAWDELGNYCLYPNVSMLVPEIGARETLYARNVTATFVRVREKLILATSVATTGTHTVTPSSPSAPSWWNPVPFSGYVTNTSNIRINLVDPDTFNLPEGVQKATVQVMAYSCIDAPVGATKASFLRVGRLGDGAIQLEVPVALLSSGPAATATGSAEIDVSGEGQIYCSASALSQATIQVTGYQL